MTHDLGLGYELAEHREGDTLLGYTVTGPAAPACRSSYGGRCGGLAPIQPMKGRSVWKVEGEWPNISLSPSVVCDCGGQHGFVKNGRYVNSGGVTA